MWWVPLATFLSVFLWLLHARWPSVGVDFRYFLLRLIDGRWHFNHQGLLPFRYTPHFCGGLPQYGNPQDTFYSLPQALAFVLDPWTAVLLSIAIALVVGYIGWLIFARDVLRFSPPWRHALAFTCIANGFYFSHVIVGHITLLLLPMLGWILWLLLDPRTDTRRSAMARGCGVGLILAARLYMGGFITIMLDGMLFLCLAPVIIAAFCSHMPSVTLRAFTWRAGLALVVTAGLCASKLVAVGAVLQMMPRTMGFERFDGSVSTLGYLLQTFWRMPQHGGYFPGTPYNVLHENSAWVSPLTIIGVACAIGMAFVPGSHAARRRSTGILLTLYAMLLAGGFVQLIRGHGMTADFLSSLPIFSSQHVATRFTYVPMMLMALVGIWGLERCCTRLFPRWHVCIAAGVIAITLLCFSLAFTTPARHEFELYFDYNRVTPLLAKPDAFTAPVTRMTETLDDAEAILGGASLIHCYEPLIFWAQYPAAKHLYEGPAMAERDGNLNVADPRCYTAGGGCPLGNPLPASESDNALRFLSGGLPAWPLPWWQRAADAITIATLLGLACIAGTIGMRRHAQRSRTTKARHS